MAEGKKKKGTRQLTPQEREPVKRLGLGTGALRAAMDYLPVPESSRRRKPVEHPWRIALVPSKSNTDVVGLEIHDDVVLGRAGASKEDSADFDLSLYDAAEHGVSRRHALLRPTVKQLFVIDLGSTNGTMINSLPHGKGMARALKHNDTLSLGKLHLTVKIVHRPEDADGRVR